MAGHDQNSRFGESKSPGYVIRDDLLLSFAIICADCCPAQRTVTANSPRVCHSSERSRHGEESRSFHGEVAAIPRRRRAVCPTIFPSPALYTTMSESRSALMTVMQILGLCEMFSAAAGDWPKWPP